jgi:hypothetical protein
MPTKVKGREELGNVRPIKDLPGRETLVYIPGKVIRVPDKDLVRSRK